MATKGGKRPNAGRPKGTIAKSTQKALLFREYLVKRVIKEQDPLVTALIKKGRSGDISAIRELFDRAFGKSKESVELSGIGGLPIEIDFNIKEVIEKVYGKTDKQRSD
jgi:hypothetical protein